MFTNVIGIALANLTQTNPTNPDEMTPADHKLAQLAVLDEPRFEYYAGFLPEEVSAMLIKMEDGGSIKTRYEIQPELNSAIKKLKEIEQNYVDEDRIA